MGLRDDVRVYWLAWLLIGSGELLAAAGLCLWAAWLLAAGALLLVAGLVAMSLILAP